MNNKISGNEYQTKAVRTINKNISNEELLINGVMGLTGESGECIDIVKKWKFQGHELNRTKLIDELSDVCWYIAITAYALGVDLEDVLAHNISKLEKRYPNGFDKDKSINRVENQKTKQMSLEEYYDFG